MTTDKISLSVVHFSVFYLECNGINGWVFKVIGHSYESLHRDCLRKNCPLENNSQLIKNPQFLPNLYETWSKWPPGKVSILTKSLTNWAKIVDFLIKAHFSMCPIFFESDFI